MPESEATKICRGKNGCRQTLPVSAFGKHVRSPDGDQLHYMCKSCNNAYMLKQSAKRHAIRIESSFNFYDGTMKLCVCGCNKEFPRTSKFWSIRKQGTGDGLQSVCRQHGTAHKKNSPALQKFGGDYTAYAKNTPAYRAFGDDVTAYRRSRPAIQAHGGSFTAYNKSVPSRQAFDGDTTAYAKSTPAFQKFGGNATEYAKNAPAIRAFNGDSTAYMDALAVKAGFKNRYYRYKDQFTLNNVRQQALRRAARWLSPVFNGDIGKARKESEAEWREEHGATCICCEQEVEKLSCDHVVPMSKQGIEHPANWVWICLTCNMRRNNKDVLDWVEDKSKICQEVYWTQFEVLMLILEESDELIQPGDESYPKKSSKSNPA